MTTLAPSWPLTLTVTVFFDVTTYLYVFFFVSCRCPLRRRYFCTVQSLTAYFVHVLRLFYTNHRNIFVCANPVAIAIESVAVNLSSYQYTYAFQTLSLYVDSQTNCRFHACRTRRGRVYSVVNFYPLAKVLCCLLSTTSNASPSNYTGNILLFIYL